MFDSTPSNLPVEPTPAPSPAPVPPPASPVPPAPAPSVAPSAPVATPSPTPPVTAPSSIQVMSPRPSAPPKPPGSPKEPEDIFSDLDQGGVARPASPLQERMMQTKPPFPLKLVVIGGVAVLVLVGIGIGVWMWFANSKTPVVPVEMVAPTTTEQIPKQIEQPPVVDQMPQQPVVVPPNGSNIPLPVTTQPTPVEPLVPPVVEDMPEPSTSTPPVKVITEGIDSDTDALTNVEETLYGTDSARMDTDGDGFSDGSEVMNLFSPTAKGVALVTDDHVQKESWNGWFFLTPKAWKVSALETRMTIATLSGTTFEVIPALNPEKLSFSAWIASGVDTAAGKSFKTKNGLDAVQTESAAGLKTYIANGDTILVVTYDVGSDPSYEYRTSYVMLINSLIPPPKK